MAVMRPYISMICAIGLLAPAAGASAQPAAAPTTLDIQADRPGATINRDLFGQFAEHLGYGIYGGVWVGKDSPIPNVRGIRSDVVAALKAIKTPVVRWPGGCYADEYHWRNGIGPQDKRPADLNPAWGGVIEPNHFGTDEYMDFLSQIGAEAYITVNVGSGSPQEASEWLEYLTDSQPTVFAKERAANGHPAPYKVKYVGLGNENWGCGGAMSTDHYVEEMKRFSHYTRDFNPAQTGDDAMKQVAVGWDSGDGDYTEGVMKAWKNKVYSWDINGVSLHNYVFGGGYPPRLPSTGFGEDDYAKALKEAYNMDNLITRQSGVMDHYDPAKKVALVVDEWGIWTLPTPGTNPSFLEQQNSLRDAILAAVNLNIFMRHADRVRMANIAQMVNVLQAMVLTDGPKMVLTPTYYVYKLYTPFQDATYLPVSYDPGVYQHGAVSMAKVDAVAARDASGQVWLSVTNIDPNQPADIDLGVVGAAASSAAGQVLTAPEANAVNTFDAPHTVEPQAISASVVGGRLHLQLPPKSVAVLAVR